MRILHIDSGREMRGGQWQALLLMEGLREAGHESLLVSPAGSQLSGKARERALNVRELGVSVVARYASGFDLLHAHDARAHTLGLTVCRLPLVVSRRVAFSVHSGAASRWKYGRADRYIAVSVYVRDRLTAAGVANERISVVYDGVEVPAELAAGDRVIAPLSHDPRKCSALAGEAADLAQVELHFSNDLAADLSSAALMLYLSEEEGLGSGALMASAHGVPVIASSVGGLREAIEHERTGLLVENDAGAVATCIKRLMHDRKEAREMGMRGRERVLREFTAAAMVHSTLAVYERLLG